MFYLEEAHAQDGPKLPVMNTQNVDSATVGTSDMIKSKVTYSAKDSMRFDVVNEKVYLYGNAKVKFEDIELQASFIKIDWTTSEIIATFTVDSAGNDVGLPEFRDGDDKFTARVMRYNVDTKQGKISQVITQQGEGYIHGETIKKVDEKSYFIKNGHYTTCDAPKPHFSISANKLKVIQDKKERVDFHTLRHTFASWLMEDGTNIYYVKDLLGHSTVKTTERYAHVGDNEKREAVLRLQKR